MPVQEISCFKAYDVRGRVPDQLNEDIARRIGRAYAEVVKPRQVVVGHDIRLTSEAIKAAVTQGLLEQGVDVVRETVQYRHRITGKTEKQLIIPPGEEHRFTRFLADSPEQLFESGIPGCLFHEIVRTHRYTT